MVWIPFLAIFRKKKSLPVFTLNGKLATRFYTDASSAELEAIVRVSDELGVEVGLEEIKPKTHILVWHRVTVVHLGSASDREGFEFALRALVSMLIIKGYTVSPVAMGRG